MKKILIILILILGSLTTNAQYIPDAFKVQQVNVTDNIVSNGWGVLGTACAGCPSYFFKITRTINRLQAEDGNYYYYYYFWFFSNSYYSNGQPASTYLTEIQGYMNDQYITSSQYMLVTRQEQYFMWMRSETLTSVTFNVNKMSVY